MMRDADLTDSDLKLICKALRVLSIISDGDGNSIEYLNKIEALNNKIERMRKRESLQARWRRRMALK